MTLKSLMLVFLIFTFWGFVSAGINCWTTNGPYGGHIESIAVDQQTPNVMYAAVRFGGFYKSSNWGQSWTLVPDVDSSTTHNIAIAIHPRNHRIIYLAAGDLYRSMDGGETWEILTHLAFREIVINPDQPDIMYGAAWDDLYKSTNGGETWVGINFGQASKSISMDAVSRNTIYVASYDDGVYKSTNGGDSWTTVTPVVGEYKIKCHPTIPNTLYLSVWDPWVFYRSTNGGQSWTEVRNYPFQDVAFDTENPDILYAIDLSGGYQSRDRGVTWDTILDFGGDSLAIGRSSTLNTLYYGTARGVFKSMDSGATWNSMNFGLQNSCSCLAVSPTELNTVYVGDAGSNLFKTTDGGINWSWISRAWYFLAMHDLEIKPDKTGTIFVGTNSDLLKSVDDGKSWSRVLSQLHRYYFHDMAINPQNSDILYISSNTTVGDFPGVYKSTDGGDSWEFSGLDSYRISDLAVDPVSSWYVYAGGQDGLFRSSNSGESWSSIMSGLGTSYIYSLAVNPGNSKTIYAGTLFDGIFKSTSRGTWWNQWGLTGEWIGAIAVDPDFPETVYAGAGDAVYINTGDNKGWELVSDNVTGSIVRDIVIDNRSPKHIYVASEKGVYSLTDLSSPTVSVFLRTTQIGNVNTELTSQILPATYLSFMIQPNTFPDASPSNPVIMEIQLPAGVVLSQTLADGDLKSTAPYPNKDEEVYALAVSEYALNQNSSAYEPISNPGSTTGIDSNAVQLFRYVSGEDKILIRINESSSSWVASSPDNQMGFTIVVGNGVWPPREGSNWGSDGVNKQESTLIFANIENYSFEENNNMFPVTFHAYEQYSKAALSVQFIPSQVNLFTLDQDLTDDFGINSQICTTVTDHTTADLNMDGIEDIISIDGTINRLYWSFGQTDGSFQNKNWREITGASLVTVDVADVTGDSHPDILLSNTNQQLIVIDWEDLFEKSGSVGKILTPKRFLKTNGIPSSSTVYDIDGDSTPDYLYTVRDSDSLTIMYGRNFQTTETYNTGNEPIALATGDFNGDVTQDVVVLNQNSNSASVFLNEGTGQLIRNDYNLGGTIPVSVATADFDRDGRTDIAFALEGDKSIRKWTAKTGGLFSPDEAQKIYFINVPSALQADNFDGEYGPDVLVGFSDFYMLALCTTNDIGSLDYAFNINTLGDMELDPVNHVTLTEDDVLSVAGGTGFGGISDRSGVAAIASQPFNLIHFPRCKDLSFSVVNLSDQNAMINLELYEDSGGYIKTVTQTILPGWQFARYLTDSELFGVDADHDQRWTRSFLSQADTYGFWLANEGASLEYLDGLKLPDIRDASSRFVLPAAPNGSNEFVQGLLINPSEKQCQMNIHLKGTKTEKTTVPVYLNGRARYVLEVNNTFPQMTESNYLLVESERPILGNEFFGDNTKIAALSAIPVTDDSDLLYCPHIAVGEFGVEYSSFLTIINTSQQGVSLSLSLYDDGGNLLSLVPSHGINAESKQILDIANLFNLTTPSTGYIVVDPQGAAGIVGYVTFGETGAGRFLSSLPLVSPSSSSFIVGHIANGAIGDMTFFTGIAILNPDEQQQSVSITAYDQEGFPLAATTLEIPSRARRVFLVDQQLPGLGDIFGGYIIIENQEKNGSELLVFALFGDFSFQFLSAVDAIPLNDK